MFAILRRGSEALDTAWRALPWWLRGLLSAGRWYGGIKGLPALVATVVSLAWSGAVLAFLQGLPMGSQVLWGAAGVLGAYGTAGHMGAALKARTGDVRLMTDRQLLKAARDIAGVVSEYVVADHDESDVLSAWVWAPLPELQQSLALEERRRQAAARRRLKRNYFNKHHGRVLTVLREMNRRGFLADDGWEAVKGSETVAGIEPIVLTAVMHLTQTLGLIDV